MRFEECVKTGGIISDDNKVCTNKQGQSFEQTTRQPQREELEEQEGEINWTTYSNQAMGFSLKYPQVWSELVESSTVQRSKVVFNNNLTIEKGMHFEQSSDIPLTFQQFIDKNTPFNKTVLDYTSNNIKGKRFIYQIGEGLQETLIALPFKDYEILTISFKAHPKAEQNVLIVKTIDSIKITETVKINAGNPKVSCVVGGCNNEICSDEKDGLVNSICVYDPKFECYKSAKCEVQEDGKCGWTQTEELSQCLSNTSRENQ